jgi:integration host factor subunit beta
VKRWLGGDRIEVRGFGSFALNDSATATRDEIRMTGETVLVPAKKVPHFTPGKELRERVESSK